MINEFKVSPEKTPFTIECRKNSVGEDKWCLCYYGRETKIGEQEQTWFDSKEELIEALNKIEMSPNEYSFAA